MATKKKDFTEALNNPALSFISGSDPEAPAIKPEQDKKPETREEAFERLKKYAEELGLNSAKISEAPKTHRVQIVTTEDLFTSARSFISGKIDPKTGRQLSMNEWINQLMQKAIDEGKED